MGYVQRDSPSLKSVSYTHLDVYKRQILRDDSREIAVIAVSYTHLFVRDQMKQHSRDMLEITTKLRVLSAYSKGLSGNRRFDRVL